MHLKYYLTTIKTVVNRMTYYLKNLLFSILTYILPDRMIRTLFISSLYSKLYNVKTLDVNIYHKVNKILNISGNDYAVGMGIQLSRAFWNGDELKMIKVELDKEGVLVLTKESGDNMIDEIIRRTPSWLHYNYSDMKRDICTILNEKMQLLNITN